MPKKSSKTKGAAKGGPLKVVMTGGPGAGKTTAAYLFQQELGKKLTLLRETATLLYLGGFPHTKEKDARRAVQSAIFQVQIHTEANLQLNPMTEIVLFDRGTLDGAAYWPEGLDSFLEMNGTSIEAEFSRYDAVLYFESAAAGDLPIAGENTTRIESLQEARNLDKRLKSIWEKHPRFHFVKHETSFFAKMESAMRELQKLLR